MGTAGMKSVTSATEDSVNNNCTISSLHYYFRMYLDIEYNNTSSSGALLDSWMLENVTHSDLQQLRMQCGQERMRVGIQAASLAIVIFCSLFANILVLIVFYQRPSLLTISNRFVFNLAISNLLITVLVMPFAFATTLLGPTWHVDAVGCEVVATATTTLFATCIYTLLLISIDRLYAIKRPLHYSMKITRVRSMIYISMVWLAALIISIPPLIIPNGITYQSDKGLCLTNWVLHTTYMKSYAFCFVLLCFLLPFTIMVWIYVTIFRAVQKTSAMARRNSVTPDANDVSAAQRMLAPPQPSTNRRRSSVLSLALMHVRSMTRRQSSNASRISFHREDWRAAKTGIIVMFTFTLCWFPMFVVIALEAGLPFQSMIHLLPTSFQAISVWLSFLVCALNPMVYVFRTRAFKQELFTLLGRKSIGQNGIMLIRETPGTPSCNGNLSKTSSAATFTRIISPRPSAVSAYDIAEAGNKVNLKTLNVQKDNSSDFGSKVKASVPL